jgi:putative methyltransferase
MPVEKKNILLFNPSYNANMMSLPYFWASSKTYYEHLGQRKDEFTWINPFFNFYNTVDEIKEFIRANPPAIFGVSLYVWNHTIALDIAAWVREEFPDCIIISGGPHQYFKHESNWFKAHTFLDASLAGDEYGELSVCDILDNYDNLNWNNVHGVVYPSRDRKIILNSRKTQNKRDFWWNYSVYRSQYLELANYKKLLETYNSSYSAIGMLETTRGCPYNCSFCDWGGGTNTKVVVKELEYVKQDIDYLAKLQVDGVFICDANYGILKERDVAIMQYIADVKKSYSKFFSLTFGGYAKTAHALPYIKQILEIEAKNYLARALTYKLSIQTLDQETLGNLDRTDVKFENYLEIAQSLQQNYGYDAFAEIIAGLPGITPDKFYHELNVFSDNSISMNFYDWYVLPETPSYHQTYRDKFKIKTVKKMFGINDVANDYGSNFERESEIVVASYSYNEQDYQQMWVSYAWYRTFWTAGFLADTIEKIKSLYGISMGEFTKRFYKDFFINADKSGKFLAELNKNIETTFAKFVDPNDKVSKLLITTEDFKDADPVRLFAFVVFLNLKDFRQELTEWVSSEWPKLSKKDIVFDLDKTITYEKFQTKQGIFPRYYYYNTVFAEETKLDKILEEISKYLSSSVPVPPLKFLRAKPVLF